MDFLKRNSGKVALLAIIAFLTLPFIYSNEEEEDFSPFAVKSGMSYQANPISKLANKIASFYGFSKPASKDLAASSGGINSIKEKVSFNKENYFGVKDKANAKKDILVASSKNFKNFDVDFQNQDNSNSHKNGRNNFSDGIYANSYANAGNNPVKGYVTVNGKKYDVIEDANGEKYVVTSKGHIPYKDLTRRVVSEQEFANAKKHFAGASDMEVLAALQQGKSKQVYTDHLNNQNYQAPVESYQNGNASTMGGTNYARVSVNDKGFDDDALSSAYADLKNINLKIEPSSTSGEGKFSYGNGALRDSYGKAAKELEIVDKGNITPQTIAGQVKTETQQNLVSKNSKLKEEKPQEEIKEEETQSVPQIIAVREDENSGVYVEEDGSNSNISFIPVEGKNSPYSVWGKISDYPFPNVEKHGIIAPIRIVRGHHLSATIEDENIQQSVERINNYVNEIEDFAFKNLQDKKIYIDKSTMDIFSDELLRRPGLSDFITDKLDEASISLPGPICTPDSFQRFVEEIKKQQMILDRQEHNPAI